MWISGMHKDYLSISAHQNFEMLVIQFKTSGSYPFLNTPIHQLNNKVIDAQELFGNEILKLREQILKGKNSSEKFKGVEKWLTNKFDVNKIASIEILDILSQLKIKPVTESSKIISSYPNTQKHLINQFKIYFGLRMKKLIFFL